MSDDLSTIQRLRRGLAGMLGFTHAGARDQWGVLGYPQLVTTQDMWNRYNRGGISNRIIRGYPQATWREMPLIRDMAGSTDEEGDEYSPFVDAVNRLFRDRRVLHYMERADRLASIGQFGVLYLGFERGRAIDELGVGMNRLMYLAPYGEPNVRVSKFVTDPSNPRFGLPEYYTLGRMGTNQSGRVTTASSFTAHWSRCIHVAEMLDSDDVYATPRLLPVYNLLLDLEKLLGAGAETFWLNARGGMSLNADKDAKLDAGILASMQKQAQDFENQLSRIIALQGTEARMLSTQVFDPTGNAERIMDQIAGTTGYPKRILIGSERGELASSQDENNWAARVDERQRNFATPSMIMPFVSRMIATGNLPVPEGDCWVEWPDSAALTPEKEAEVGNKKADTLSKYLSAPGADLVVPVEEFRIKFLGLPATSEFDDTDDEDDLDETNPEVLAAAAGQELVPTGGDAVQDTALNGAQIAALQSIAVGVGDGTMADETAIQIIMAGFPGIAEDEARKIIEPMVAIRAEVQARADEMRQLMAPGADAGEDEQDADEPGAEPGAEPPAPDDASSPAANLNHLARAIRVLRTNASPRSLYVHRAVLNAEEIRAHFRSQGILVMVPDEEMHVTVAHSRTKLDWFRIAPAWNQEADGTLNVPPGGPRMLDLFGREMPRRVLVLMFSSSQLAWRHEDFKQAGATWQWPTYDPHITLSYDVTQSWPDDKTWDDRLRALRPWQGRIELGPEIFEEVSDGWSEGLRENRSQP